MIDGATECEEAAATMVAHGMTLADVERAIICAALREHGSQAEAARKLGMSPSRIGRAIRTHEISIEVVAR